MRDVVYKSLAYLFVFAGVSPMYAQTGSGSSSTLTALSSEAPRNAELEKRVETISSALALTRQQLDDSQRRMRELQDELDEIKKQLASRTQVDTPSDAVEHVNSSMVSRTEMKERQETLEAQVKLHDQTKVESGSKYPVRLKGLILFNAFTNRGTVDNIESPAIATRQRPEVSDGTVGATLRQTIIGIEGSGPKIAGARTSADVNLDFFGGVAYSNFGTASGLIRLRTASINLDWTRDSVQVGMVTSLISPLSPTSYATVAEPGMAWAGNLWTWAPQLKVSHRFLVQEDRQVKLEFGLWDPPAAGYNSSEVFRTPSPGEQAKQPAYETRLSFGSGAIEHGLQVGIAGYYSRQWYSSTISNDSWAATADWRIPLRRHFEVSGEAYRGRSLGGLGGGVYKDVLNGVDAKSGQPSTRGLNDIGAWLQFKSRFGQSLEGNLAIGQDNGFAKDFHALILPATASATQLRARNKMVMGNVIFRPKTYLIVSPEYRRIWTWPIYGAGNTANVFTLSLGYEF